MAREISGLCVAAKLPEVAADFVTGGLDVEQARARLAERVVAASAAHIDNTQRPQGEQDRTAGGLSATRIVIRHALRAALLPLVSYLGPAVAAILTGSLIVEEIFGIPGIGRYFVQGALNRDYTLVMGVVICYASLIILLNFLADIAYGLLDPRVRLT